MKTFETPIVEVKTFAVEDILTASSTGFLCGPLDTNNNGCYRDYNQCNCPSDDCNLNVEGPCPDDD